MKQIVVFLVLVIVAIASQSVWGQTAQEKSQMRFLEKEIDNLKNEIVDLEKGLEKEKAMAVFQLKKEVKQLEMQADPKRAQTVEEIESAKKSKVQIEAKIDSVESIYSYWELEMKKEELDNLKEKRKEILASWVDSDEIPKELTILTKNRRLRANTIRREELVLSKIEDNISQQISPSGSEGGYKVIFDNKYSLGTTFILRGVDGGQRLAISLSPRTKERHYVLPGRYLVEYIVNGRKLSVISNLMVDGEKHYYESEPCFGFVYKSRY